MARRYANRRGGLLPTGLPGHLLRDTLFEVGCLLPLRADPDCVMLAYGRCHHRRPARRSAILGDGENAAIMDASKSVPEGVPPHWLIYFAVDDADETLAKASSWAGSTVLPAGDIPHGRIASTADVTGALYKIRADN